MGGDIVALDAGVERDLWKGATAGAPRACVTRAVDREWPVDWKAQLSSRDGTSGTLR
jgi:hypothetical protein